MTIWSGSSKISAWYLLIAAFVATAWAVRLLFFRDLGSSVPYILFFPAVILSALYGGAGPSIVAATLSVLIANYYWVEPYGHFAIADPAQWTSIGLF
jgi:K+-sensing histidine kinase KdpD